MKTELLTHATLLALAPSFTQFSDIGRRACDGEKERNARLLVTRRQAGKLLFVNGRRPTCPTCAVKVDEALEAGKVVARRKRPFNTDVRAPIRRPRVGADRSSQANLGDIR